MTLKENPFFQKDKTPFDTVPFHLIKNEHFEPAILEGICQQKKEIEAICNQEEKPSFKNTIEALEYSGELLTKICDTFFPLQSVNSDEEMMLLAQKISPLIVQHSNNVYLNQALFFRIKDIYQQKDELVLTIEEKTLLENTYKSFVRSGALLEQKKKEQLQRITQDLTQVTLLFGQNILRESNLYQMCLTKPEEVAGLPKSILEQAKEEAKLKKKKGYLFTLSAPSYLSFMKYAKNRNLRERFYKDYSSRCAHGGIFDNQENCQKIANLRLEMVNLLGYNCYADYVLENRMAQKKENVYELLNKLQKAYSIAAHEEVSDLEDFAIGEEGKNIQLMPWDWSFYTESFKKVKYHLDEEELKPYFELNKVKQGVFDLAKTLYGIVFKPNKEIATYHPDVETFEVYDKDNTFLAILYTDFFPRPTKQNGAWMTEFRGEYMKEGKEYRPHVSIVMNFTKPTKTTPSLLTFNEIKTFLHEFGHAIHGILAKGKYPSLTGTNVYRDFVELPSQLMENWSTQKDYLDQFAIHYITGEKIPTNYIERLKKASSYHTAYACYRQLSFAYIDMAWHTLTQPYNKEVFQLEQKATEKVQLLPSIKNGMISTAFSHVFSGGYAAGYYSYKWAEVLDADAFSLFQEKGIFNQDIANLFRSKILEKGGTEDPMILYKQFRGKEPDIEALLIRDNILKI